MTEEKQYLTKEKFQEFKKELDTLQTVRRKEVAESLEYAKKLGDLSENAEYQQAREEQAALEDRIRHLEQIMKTAAIVDDRHSDTVGIGSKVRVQKNTSVGGSNGTAGSVGTAPAVQAVDAEQIYKIVGSEEADMTQGKVSNLSPLGAALIGKKKGEAFVINTPKGKIGYRLIAIEK